MRVRRSSPYSFASASISCAHQFAQLGLAGEQRLELVALLGQLLLLLADLHLLELRQMAQLGLEDRLGLLVRELEALDQHRLGLLLAPDDADHFIQIQIGDQQAIEDVQPARDLVEPVLQAAAHRRAGGTPATR